MKIDFVLLRGLARESSHWCDFPEILQEAFPDSRVFMIEQSGSGIKTHERAPLQINTQVHRFHEELALLRGDTQNRLLVGIAVSMGGMILLSWAHAYSHFFDHCFLINSSVAQLSLPWQRMQPLAFQQLTKSALVSLDEREAIILKLVTNHPETFERYIQQWQAIQRQRPNQPVNVVRQLVAAARFSIQLDSSTSRYHVLASTFDRLCSVECSRAIAKKLGCSIAEHPTAGHDLCLDDHEWVIKQLRETLR